jgi:hypothetical protein
MTICLPGLRVLKLLKRYIAVFLIATILAAEFADSQEALAEKQSILDEFAESVRRKTEVEEVQRPLLIEADAFKKNIEEFGERQNAVTVHIVPLCS